MSESESEQEDYECSLCHFVFDSEKLLKKHRRKDHNIIEGLKLKCPTPKCSYSTNMPEEMDHHLVIHNGMKFYKCTYCSKVFMIVGMLQRHVLKHTGKAPFVCGVCKKMFLAAEAKIPQEGDSSVCSICADRLVNCRSEEASEVGTSD